jgi:valyl-tRNA synthetase
MYDSVNKMNYPNPATNPDDLPRSYEGLERERFWQQYWREARVYEFSLYVDDSGADGPVRQSSDADTAVRATKRLRSRAEIFSIDTPPPTVSGSLHIGHVYSYTQTDMSARYQRMRGKHVFYPFGFDDNGLPTERLVEREKGIKAHEYIKEHGREAFIALCREVVEKYEAQFVELWQSLALSCDWNQFYTTIGTIRDGQREDPDLARAISQASFIDLYKKGIIYRKDAPTQWCWADQTAIAQAEIEDREVPGFFHDIKFFWADGPGQPIRGELVIATTRPELIPACVAVMVNPESEEFVKDHTGAVLNDYSGQPVKHKDLIGRIAITPLFEVEVPILPSEKVQLDKGTGILMCCTFGDMEDVEHWKQFNLPTRVIIGKDGRIDSRIEALGNEDWPTRNQDAAAALTSEMLGQKVRAAQQWTREKLSEAGLMLEQRNITHTVRHSERGGVPIEILVTPQWYVNILEHKAELIEQGRRIRWTPEYMRKRYEQWVDGLNADWCISRQRYNGIPFPVWYEAGTDVTLPDIDRLPVNPLSESPLVRPGRAPAATSTVQNNADSRGAPRPGKGEALSTAAAAARGGPTEFIPDPDVMDTWATSSVTPLLNTHLVLGIDGGTGALATAVERFHQDEADARHAALFPFDMRPQAHDIIRTWAFYTIAKAYFHFGQIPWKDIVISGHAQDANRQKMSKSRGNVVTPAEMVEKYTADGLRYWSGSCKLGTDTVYDEKTLGEGRKLINKLFNATKFALRHLIGFDPTSVGAEPARPADIETARRGGVPPPPTDGESNTGGHGSPPLLGKETDGRSDAPPPLDAITYPTDLWLIGRLNETIARATKAQDEYDFADAKQAVEDFFWADFCDNYLELSKGRLYGEPLALEAHTGEGGPQWPPENSAQGRAPSQFTPEELRLSAQATLYIALSSVLRMFAPCLPHITEECWSWYFAQFSDKRSIHEESWPEAAKTSGADGSVRHFDAGAAARATENQDAAATLLLATLLAVRKAKSELGVSIKKPLSRLDIYAVDGGIADGDGVKHWDAANLLQPVLGDLLSACNTAEAYLCSGPPPEGAVSTEKNPVAVACRLVEEEG